MHAQITYQDQSRWGQNLLGAECARQRRWWCVYLQRWWCVYLQQGSEGFRELITRHLVTPLGWDYTNIYTAMTLRGSLARQSEAAALAQAAH